MSQDTRPMVRELQSALFKLASTPPRIISSPRTQPRRAAVAIILRIVPAKSHHAVSLESQPQPSLSQFFALDWVNSPDAKAEILFLRRNEPVIAPMERAARTKADSHATFPGGKMEEGDEGGLYTAMRYTWEEIGLDLAEQDFICVGQLDDREITTSLGKRLLMILSPFVFLQVTPRGPVADPSEGTTLHWTPLAALADTNPQWSHVTVDVASRLAPRNSDTLRVLIRLLIGSMQFSAMIVKHEVQVVPDKKTSEESTGEMKLWGLTLGIVLDMLSYMDRLPAPDDTEINFMLPHKALPSMRSVFPRFSYPDVNFWIWVFGKRYREVVREWEESVQAGGSNDRRINWVGTALNAFYQSVRKALIMVFVLRGVGVLLGGGFSLWWFFSRS